MRLDIMDILVQMEQRDSGIILVLKFPQIFISEAGFENTQKWGKTAKKIKKKYRKQGVFGT